MIDSGSQFVSLPGSVVKGGSGRGKKALRVMGIDPGLANTGFGIIDSMGGKFRMVSYGVIETAPTQSHGERLLSIYSRLQAVIDEFRPDEASMETLYFARRPDELHLELPEDLLGCPMPLPEEDQRDAFKNVVETVLGRDCDFENVKNIAGSISPVPGGVGPMTIAMLLENTLLAYKRQHHLNS